MISEQKRELRRRIRSCGKAISPEDLAVASARICRQVEGFEPFAEARTVALYWSLAGEVSTHELVRKYASCKRIVLPVVTGEVMHFAEVAEDCSNLIEGAFGVMEPREGRVCPPEEIELMVVPGMAFDCRGGRLGHGKGYYDRYFEQYTGPKVGICFDFQMVDEVPCESFDVRVDAVFAEKKYICSR